MITLSNRDVFVFGHEDAGGFFADAIWLKYQNIAGTTQELWDREQGTVYGLFQIPKGTDQVHTEILLPYGQLTLGNQATAAHRN